MVPHYLMFCDGSAIGAYLILVAMELDNPPPQKKGKKNLVSY